MDDWLNTDKHCIDIVPVGSGKTFLAAVALPLFATDEKYHKGRTLYIVHQRGNDQVFESGNRLS
jgi:superfamily II DNA or RNA helicase